MHKKPTLIYFNKTDEIHKISVAVSQRYSMVFVSFPQAVHIAYSILKLKYVLYYIFFNKH